MNKERTRKLPDRNELLRLLNRIYCMCVGEIAMGNRMDAEYMGRIIFECTGMTAEELALYCKKMNNNENRNE